MGLGTQRKLDGVKAKPRSGVPKHRARGIAKVIFSMTQRDISARHPAMDLYEDVGFSVGLATSQKKLRVRQTENRPVFRFLYLSTSLSIHKCV